MGDHANLGIDSHRSLNLSYSPYVLFQRQERRHITGWSAAVRSH